jgi:hypothetical protein
MTGIVYNLLECSDSAVKIYGLRSVNQVLEQHLTKPGEETDEEEEVAEHKATFLDTPKGLEAATKYICQFDINNSINVMCSKVDNELYRLRAQAKWKQKALIEWLKK